MASRDFLTSFRQGLGISISWILMSGIGEFPWSEIVIVLIMLHVFTEERESSLPEGIMPIRRHRHFGSGRILGVETEWRVS